MTDADRPRGFKSRRSPQAMAVALFKDCNAGLDPLGRSLWASRDRASGGCSQPEERAVALGCKRPGTSWEAAVRSVAPLGKGKGHSRRGAPCGQPLPNSLHPSLSPGWSTGLAASSLKRSPSHRSLPRYDSLNQECLCERRHALH